MISWITVIHIYIQHHCYHTHLFPWWRHQMETLPALAALCTGNSPVTGEFLLQRPVTRSFGVFFHLRLNKPLSKQSWAWWFETPSCPLWPHCNSWIGWWHSNRLPRFRNMNTYFIECFFPRALLAQNIYLHGYAYVLIHVIIYGYICARLPSL